LVMQLITERSQLRRDRDYERADEVRDELKRMGVSLWDRDKVWTTGGQPPRRRAQPEFQARFGETRIFVENLDFETSWQDLKDHFREAGYPVVYASISYDREARCSKGCGIVQFETVDATTDAIERMSGSELDGRNIICRPDVKTAGPAALRPSVRPVSPERRLANQYGNDRTFRRQYNVYGHDYDRSELDETPLEEQTLMDVHKLLRLRLDAKLSRNFEYADQLLDDINQMGVEVNDGLKQWRADGLPFVRTYKFVGNNDDEAIDKTLVHTLLSQRSNARRERDYIRADELLLQLHEMNVQVNDKARTWTIDPTDGEHNYNRWSWDNVELDSEALEEINHLLSERLQAKKDRLFESADAIQLKLKSEFNVEVDDKSRQWCVRQI